MLKSIKNIVAAAAFVGLSVSTASAAPITLQASISGIVGNAGLLAELGITDGTATAFVTFDADVSSGATLNSNQLYTFTELDSAYTSYSVVTPSKTINAIPSDAANNTIFTRDGISDLTGNINDVFNVYSFNGSGDPNSYWSIFLQSSDLDETKWSRTNPISASLLNSFDTDVFTLQKYLVSGQFLTRIDAFNITWSEVSQVPLPAALPLLGGALSLLGFLGWRRKRIAPSPLS